MNKEIRVLIVDDENMVRLNMRALLEDLGFIVSESSNGYEALKVYEQEAPDLVLTDLRMPEMDGLTLIAALHEKNPDAPVIVISGTGNIHDAIEAVRKGAWDYITKPVNDQNTFEIIIRRSLERARLIQENHRYREHLEDLVRERTLDLHEQAVMLEQEMAERQVAQEALAVEHHKLQLLNATLEERVREAVEKNREQEQLIAHQSRLTGMAEMMSNIAHQWRQPLNNIGLLIQNLQYDYADKRLDEAHINDCVQACMNNFKYMSQTISDFQYYFKPDREQQTFEVASTIRDAVNLVQAGILAMGISLRIHEQGSDKIIGFTNEFVQVILNIINNAKDALIERRVPDPMIEISSLCEGDKVMVIISDNAGGINADAMEKIFDPYFTTKFQSQGTGIGLYMAKMIIEKNMNGRVSAHNTPQGAEFTLEIPRYGSTAE